MRDLLYVALMLAFFASAMGFVRVCDRLIGPDELPDALDDAAPAGEAVAA